MTHASTHAPDHYYVPDQSYWPIIASIGLFTLMLGGATVLNGGGNTLLLAGAALILLTMFGWFGTVVYESERGLYSDQMDRSFRWGMGWFIFSEVMFFAAFFGALFYARQYAVPWLGGETSHGVLTQSLLWPQYEAAWPTNGPGDIGGFFAPMRPWGLPALNTLILLSSGATITWAHWGMVENRRGQWLKGLAATIVLGVLFLTLQAVEYRHAYQDLYLTLGSGTFIDGFEDQIVGHMPGETFDVNVTFPDDYQATNLAGKDAVFATTLNYINEDVTPDLTDDWVSSNLAESMGMNNVAELKTFVSNSLLFNQEANELYGQLYDAAEVNTDTLPEDVQQYFTNTVLYQPYLYAQMRGVSLETMLSQAGYSSVDEYLENSESSKQSMIKQILIMQALAEKNNIVCDTDILNAEFSRYFGSTDMTSYVNAYGENYVKTNILHDIVMQNQIDNVA